MTAVEQQVPLDETKLNAFFGRVLDDWGGTLGSALVVIGDKLGLYQALQRQPLSVEELATTTNTHPRYIREWLLNQAADRVSHLRPRH